MCNFKTRAVTGSCIRLMTAVTLFGGQKKKRHKSYDSLVLRYRKSEGRSIQSHNDREREQAHDTRAVLTGHSHPRVPYFVFIMLHVMTA